MPSVTRRMIARFVALPDDDDARPGDRLVVLTAREREVLGQIAVGRSNAEIAREFVVSENTVKTHVGNVLMKLQLRDRVHAVILAPKSPNLVRPR